MEPDVLDIIECTMKLTTMIEQRTSRHALQWKFLVSKSRIAGRKVYREIREGRNQEPLRLHLALEEFKPGNEVDVVIKRGNDSKTLRVELEKRSNEEEQVQPRMIAPRLHVLLVNFS